MDINQEPPQQEIALLKKQLANTREVLGELISLVIPAIGETERDILKRKLQEELK